MELPTNSLQGTNAVAARGSFLSLRTACNDNRLALARRSNHIIWRKGKARAAPKHVERVREA